MSWHGFRNLETTSAHLMQTYPLLAVLETQTYHSKLSNSPRGSEYPNSKVLGSKIHTLNGVWTLTLNPKPP